MSNSRIVVDEHEPEVDIEKPPFSPRHVTLRNDKAFADEFKVIDFLGRGKFGEVKRCVELSTGREFAAKFIATPRPQDRKDVEHEVEMMRRLHHRRLVQLYDAFESKKEMCLVLEIVYGGELFDRAISDDFLLTEKACVCIVRQICEGVEYIHSQNIIHLDMKPENILCLTKTGNRIKIIDFGLARDYNPKVDTRVLFGTPEFMAPEVVQFDPIDFSTDMWSIGVICYVLLSGLSPFMGDNDADTLSNVIRGRFGFEYPEFRDVSLDAKDMISKLLVTDKKKRLSATQCLNHPWLKRRQQPKTPTLDLTKIQLKHFVYRRKWQKVVNALIALKRMGVDIRVIRSHLNGSLTKQENTQSRQENRLSANKPAPTPSTTQAPAKAPDQTAQKSNPDASSGPEADDPSMTRVPAPRKAGVENVPVAGNGHVFNLSKMIQLNKAANREHSNADELAQLPPIAVWQQRDHDMLQHHQQQQHQHPSKTTGGKDGSGGGGGGDERQRVSLSPPPASKAAAVASPAAAPAKNDEAQPSKSKPAVQRRPAPPPPPKTGKVFPSNTCAPAATTTSQPTASVAGKTTTAPGKVENQLRVEQPQQQRQDRSPSIEDCLADIASELNNVEREERLWLKKNDDNKRDEGSLVAADKSSSTGRTSKPKKMTPSAAAAAPLTQPGEVTAAHSNNVDERLWSPREEKSSKSAVSGSEKTSTPKCSGSSRKQQWQEADSPQTGLQGSASILQLPSPPIPTTTSKFPPSTLPRCSQQHQQKVGQPPPTPPKPVSNPFRQATPPAAVTNGVVVCSPSTNSLVSSRPPLSSRDAGVPGGVASTILPASSSSSRSNKDQELIRDRVRFFNKKDVAGVSSPSTVGSAVNAAGQQSSTPLLPLTSAPSPQPAKNHSWFKRNNVFNK